MSCPESPDVSLTSCVARDETIIVNRVLREDPSKSDMHNREPVTPSLLWKSLKDFDLWPLYILGLTFQIPTVPQTAYFTLTLRNLGWTTFEVNLLTIPYYVAHSKYMVSAETLPFLIANLYNTSVYYARSYLSRRGSERAHIHSHDLSNLDPPFAHHHGCHQSRHHQQLGHLHHPHATAYIPKWFVCLVPPTAYPFPG